MTGLAAKMSDAPNTGRLMLFIAALLLVPLVVVPFYPGNLRFVPSFLTASGVSAGLGLAVCLAGRPSSRESDDWRSSLARSCGTVLFIWVWGSLVGAIPFMLGMGMTPLHALFESVSGWSTTGLSVIDVRATPQVFMFHRCFMQYCGGLGFVLMMILVIANRESMNLYDAEGHPDKILPNLRSTAWAIFFVYNVCLILGTVAYLIAGLNFFDSLYHAMCALSTGGFSNKLGSIGDFQSVPVEAITIVLMVIGMTNFATLLLLVQGKFKKALATSELRFMAVALVACTVLLSWNLADSLGLPLGEALRQGAFSATTAMSTCGFSTSDFSTWPPFSLAVMIVVMFVGGGFGSTSGGFKLRRAYIALRVAWADLRRRFSPRDRVESPVYRTAQGPAPIDGPLVSNTMCLLMVYLVCFLIGTLALCLTSGYDLASCMFEFASSLSGVGVSIGMTGPQSSPGTLIVEMVGMFIGRLEIIVVFVGAGAAWGAWKSWLHRRARRSSGA